MADSASIRAALQEFMKRTRESPSSGHRPPNLTVTDDTHKNCSTCKFWKEGLCTLYQYHTRPNEVCDSWSPIEEGSR